MKLIDFMEICKGRDVSAVANAMTQAWGLDADTALASAQQWVPHFRGFAAQGAMMELYGDVGKGEDAKALATLKDYYMLDAASAATALAAIRSTL